jgi:ribosomal protein L35
MSANRGRNLRHSDILNTKDAKYIKRILPYA